MQNVVAVLGHIRAMQVIVVRDRAHVSVVNLNHELQVLVPVNQLIQTIGFNKCHRNHRHLHLAAYHAREFKNIKVKGRQPVIKLWVLTHYSIHFFGGDHPVNIQGINTAASIELNGGWYG